MGQRPIYKLLFLHFHRADHVKEVIALSFLISGYNDADQRIREIDFNKFTVSSSEGIKKELAVKADDDVIAGFFDRDLVVNTAGDRNGGDFNKLIVELTSNAAFRLTESLVFGNEGSSFKSGDKDSPLAFNEGFGSFRNNSLKIDVIGINKTREEGFVFKLKDNVLSAEVDFDNLFLVAHKLHKLSQSFAGDDEGKIKLRAVGVFVNDLASLFTDSETVAVAAHHLKKAVSDLKESAAKHRSLIGGSNCEQGLIDHFAKSAGGNAESSVACKLRQSGEG